jgi:hypothetical protein
LAHERILALGIQPKSVRPTLFPAQCYDKAIAVAKKLRGNIRDLGPLLLYQIFQDGLRLLSQIAYFIRYIKARVVKIHLDIAEQYSIWLPSGQAFHGVSKYDCISRAHLGRAAVHAIEVERAFVCHTSRRLLTEHVGFSFEGVIELSRRVVDESGLLGLKKTFIAAKARNVIIAVQRGTALERVGQVYRRNTGGTAPESCPHVLRDVVIR